MAENDTLTVVREMGDAYIVRINRMNEETGKREDFTDTISRDLFKACVRTGYLQKISNE